MSVGEALPRDQFVNPIGEGADPFVVLDGDRYLWCKSEGDVGISVWESDRLTSLGTKYVVWEAPPGREFSKEVWAPELHLLDGRWYIYFAASDGNDVSHRAYVLAADTEDPLGTFTLHGPLYTGENEPAGASNLWAIDMTVLEHAGQQYAIWSGWPDEKTRAQHLYIAPMDSPVTLSGPRSLLCAADDFLWERVDESPTERGLNEAPQVLRQASRTFLLYSCSGSWQPHYKEGILELTGSDPMDPSSWTKTPSPAFASSPSTYGVGHGQLVRSPDRSQWWQVYHAKRDRRPGWRRAIFIQPVSWADGGAPDLGTPVAPGEAIRVPSGSPLRSIGADRDWDFAGQSSDIRDFDYYGHHQFYEHGPDGLHLGRHPAQPVNAYRCGEKFVLRDALYSDLVVSTEFSFVEGDRAAGLLFRATGPAIGYDAQRGYFAGIVPRRNAIMLGMMDGTGWTQLAEAPYQVQTGRRERLSVRAVGDVLEVYLAASQSPALRVRDATYHAGSIGIRVVDTHARFTTLRVESIDPT